jgi:thiol-disulfide isomerase/thioredoxin
MVPMRWKLGVENGALIGAAALGIALCFALPAGAGEVPPAAQSAEQAEQVAAPAEARAQQLFDAAHARFKKGRSLQRLHRNTEASLAEFEAARDGYRKAVDANPQGPLAARALYMSGSASLFMGQPDAAVRTYAEVVERYPGDPSYAAKALVKKASVEVGSLQPAAAGRTLAEFRTRFPDGVSESLQKSLTRVERSLREIGQPAPELQIQRWVGAEASPSLAGQVTFLFVFATWCPNCLKELGFVDDLRERYAGRGLKIVAVTNHTRGQDDAAVERYVAQHGLRYPVGIDDAGRTVSAYSGSSVPVAAMVDRDGVIRWHGHPAGLSDALIEVLLSEEERS